MTALLRISACHLLRSACQYLPSEEIEAPDSLNKSEPIWMGNTFSGGRIDGGCPEDVLVPLALCEPCDEAVGKFTVGRGVEPVACLVLLAPTAPVLRSPREVVGCSDELDPSSGDDGPMPDIRSKVTERGFTLVESRSGFEEGPSGRDCLSDMESVEAYAVELAFRFRTDLGCKG